MVLLLENNNINLPDDARKKDNQYWNNQPEIGHALMVNVSNPRVLLIDSSDLNHMVA